MKPVFWHQGMFLQPQHFQLSDQYQQFLTEPYRQLSQPHFWGASQIELLTSALEHRSCEIQAGEFLFPDGAYAKIANNAVVASRSFDDAWVETDKSFTIYLGLKKQDQYEENVTVMQNLSKVGDVHTRYLSLANPEEVRDAYQKSPNAQVKALQYVLKIIWETEIEAMEDYMLIPIAQVEMGEGAVQYSKDFIPSVMTLNAAPDLLRIVKEIRDELTGRAIQLGIYNEPDKETNKYDATHMRYKQALRSLSRFIPRLFHLTEDGPVHPWVAYGVLRELIGEISTFTDLVNILGENKSGERLMPSYDHQSLGVCFSTAKNLITQLLNQITIGPQYLVEMPSDGVCYTAPVPQEFFDQRVDFYLVINSEIKVEQYQPSLLTAAKLASRESVEVLAERSLPGVGLINVPVPPTELPRRPNTAYVRLDVHDDQWATVERHRDVALLWDEAPEDVTIELVIVRR